MSAAQLAKYEAWIEELERRQTTLAASRTLYFRFFIGAAVASTIGFAWNPWVGAGTLCTGLLFSAFGFYVVLVRERDYVRELQEARATARRLSATAVETLGAADAAAPSHSDRPAR